jgi:hypothetical protein
VARTFADAPFNRFSGIDALRTTSREIRLAALELIEAIDSYNGPLHAMRNDSTSKSRVANLKGLLGLARCCPTRQLMWRSALQSKGVTVWHRTWGVSVAVDGLFHAAERPVLWAA